MQDQVLADRLVGYADALVAAAFLGMSALSIALGDPDIRCSIAQARVPVAAINVVSGVVLTTLLFHLRRWEFDLRSVAPSLKSAKYSQYLHVARLVVVWFCAIACIILIMISTTEGACPASGSVAA